MKCQYFEARRVKWPRGKTYFWGELEGSGVGVGWSTVEA